MPQLVNSLGERPIWFSNRWAAERMLREVSDAGRCERRQRPTARVRLHHGVTAVSELHDRRLDLLSRIVGDADGFDVDRLCEVSADATGVTSAGILLVPGEPSASVVCATDEVASTIGQLQYELGEGPSIDAHHRDAPVLEPDLACPDRPAWPAFTSAALDIGIRAVFSFPLHVGAIRLGTLDLHRHSPGALTDHQHADALVLADIAAQTVLLLQAGAPEGEIAEELSANEDFHSLVHQASGMVAAQLGVSVETALVRLRAHAFGNERRLTDVARDVVERRLRFTRDDHSG